MTQDSLGGNELADAGVGRPTNSLLDQATSGLAWTTMGTVVQAVMQLLVLGLLARLLEPSEFGLITATLLVVGMLDLFSRLGVGPAVVQRADLTDEHQRTAFALSLYSGIVLAATLFLTAPFLASVLRLPELTPLMRAMAAVFIIQSPATVAAALLVKDLRFRTTALIAITSFTLGYGLVGVVAALAGLGAWSLVIGQLAQTALRTALFVMVRSHPRSLRMRLQEAKDLLYFGIGFTASRIGNYAAGQGDYFVVARWMDATALGVYGRAYQLMAMPATFVGQILDRVLFPVMAKMQDSQARLGRAYRNGTAAVSLLVLPISGVAIVLAPELVAVLLGDQWDEVVPIFRILGVGLLFRTSYKISDSLSRATGRVYARAWRQVIYAALVFGGAFWGREWGLEGVAVGVFIAIAVNFFLMAHLSMRITGLGLAVVVGSPGRGLPLGALAGVVAVAGTLGLRALNTPSFVTLIVAGLLAVLSMGGAIWAAPDLMLGAEGRWLRTQLGESIKSARKRKGSNARQEPLEDDLAPVRPAER
ncbi:MAG: lipopolysaccharide biosynthesis protein [Acidimicrobiia bacterium]